MTDKERGNAIDWLNDLANTPAEEWQIYYSWSETKENATNVLVLLKEQEGTINELQNTYGYLQKLFFEAQDKLLKEQEAEPKFKKLKVPEKCGECKSCNAAITGSPYCYLEAASPVNSQMDISSIYVNIDSRPVWCPISKMNDELDRMTFEKRAKFEKLITGLSSYFGGEDLWE